MGAVPHEEGLRGDGDVMKVAVSRAMTTRIAELETEVYRLEQELKSHVGCEGQNRERQRYRSALLEVSWMSDPHHDLDDARRVADEALDGRTSPAS